MTTADGLRVAAVVTAAVGEPEWGRGQRPRQARRRRRGRREVCMAGEVVEGGRQEGAAAARAWGM